MTTTSHTARTALRALPAELRAEWYAANRHIAEHGVPADDRAWDDLNARMVEAIGLDGVEALVG